MSSEPGDAVLEQILAEVATCVHQVVTKDLEEAARWMEFHPRIFVAGAGRSSLCMRALGMRLMHLGKTVYVAGETTTPAITETDLLILGSGSGRTVSLLAIAGQARRQNAKILLFTADAASPLAELADHRVVIPAPSLKNATGINGLESVQPMGTLFEQSMFILCDRLILGIMQNMGVTAAQMLARHANLE